MDDGNRNRLEEIRKRTPRYLFRVWSNTPGQYSGGYRNLNTKRAITPLAFHRGNGTPRVYDMTAAEFTDIAWKHLRTCSNANFETQFSSWSPSLSYVMDVAASFPESAQISILDTSKASDNGIFHVPLLQHFDREKFFWYSWEYLAHGIITGQALRAIPLQAFRDAGFETMDGHVHGLSRWTPGAASPLSETEELVQQARKIGEQYGGAFTLPVTLALICRNKRDRENFRNGIPELQTVLNGLEGLYLPTDWDADATIMEDDVVNIQGWGEVEQLIRLMRACAELPLKESEKAKTRRRRMIGRESIVAYCRHRP